MSAAGSKKALTKRYDLQVQCHKRQAFVHCVVINDTAMGGMCVTGDKLCCFFGCVVVESGSFAVG
jgi:hypothetical protein